MSHPLFQDARSREKLGFFDGRCLIWRPARATVLEAYQFKAAPARGASGRRQQADKAGDGTSSANFEPFSSRRRSIHIFVSLPRFPRLRHEVNLDEIS
jgi:hypothetical protein